MSARIKENTPVKYKGKNREFLLGRTGTVIQLNTAGTSAMVNFPATSNRLGTSEWVAVTALDVVSKFDGVTEDLNSQREENGNRIREIDREILKLQHERDELYNKNQRIAVAIQALERV